MMKAQKNMYTAKKKNKREKTFYAREGVNE